MLLVLIMACMRQRGCEWGHGNCAGTPGVTPDKAFTGKPPCTKQAQVKQCCFHMRQITETKIKLRFPPHVRNGTINTK